MPSNVIIFDADYIAEITSNMNTACGLVGEAVSFLKKASLHEGWQCKECVTISDSLDDLNRRLGRLDEGVNETTRILRGSVGRFEELERQYRDQTDSLSRELRSNYGFTASGYSGSSGSSGSSWAGSAPGSMEGGAVPGTPAGQGSTYVSPGSVSAPQNPSPSVQTPADTSGITGQQEGSPGVNIPSGNIPASQTGTAQTETVQTVQTETAQNEMPKTDTAQTGTGTGTGYTGTGTPQTGTAQGNAAQSVIIQTGTNQTYTPSAGSEQTYTPSWSITPSGDIQLPVTHIPDKPEAVAGGVKAVVEVEGVAVNSVTDSIFTLLGSSEDISSMPPEVQYTTANSIVQTYSAGRQVTENTAAIISNPSIAHIQENIAIASGVVNLIGGLSRTLSMLGIPGLEGFEDLAFLSNIPEGLTPGAVSPESVSSAAIDPSDPEVIAMNASVSGDAIAEDVMGADTGMRSGMHFTSAGLATNAESIIGNMGNDADSQEVKEVLQTFTSKGGGQSVSSSSDFLDRIKSSIMEKMQGGVSLGVLGSVNIKDFLEKVI